MGMLRRMFRKPNFFKMRHGKDVEGLIKIFQDPKRSPNEDSKVRDTLVHIVHDCIEEKDMGTIREIYKSAKAHEIRSALVNAVEGLGELKDRWAVEPLIDDIQNPGLSTSVSAVALGKIGDERAIKPLIEALSNEYEERVRRLPSVSVGISVAAGMALCRFKERAIGPLVEARRRAEKAGDNTMSTHIDGILKKIQKEG